MLERPISIRYSEVQEFPHALNMSQLLNWQTHLFLAESREALANANAGGPPAKYTPEELDGLQRVLDDPLLALGRDDGMHFFMCYD